MSTLDESSTPGNSRSSPFLFFDTLQGYQRTAAIKAAIELDVFTAVGEGARTVADLARRCGASERGARILCDYLAATGFLTKDTSDAESGGRYGLTPDSATFLDRRSPAYMGGAIEFLLSPQITDAFRDLTAAARKGGTALPQDGTVSAENPVWVKFARAMAPMMAAPAERTAALLDPDASGPLKVFDIAAGHGLYGLAFARRNPQAQVVAQDWAPVLEVAAENARKAGVVDRFRTLPGSAFEVDFGGGYDVVLLPNFLHHFDPPACERVLRKVRASLAEGGRAAAVEFIPDENRLTPPHAVAFAMTMLATTPRGDAYTFAEYQAMFASAGFARCELHELPQTLNRVVIAS